MKPLSSIGSFMFRYGNNNLPSETFCGATVLKVMDQKTFVDCSQSPIFPCDRRDRANLTINGGHLDF